MSELIKDLDTLQFADYNPRIIKEQKDVALGNTMNRFGDISGIVNNMQTGRLVCGHQRVRKLREKYGTAPQIYIEQRKAEPDEFGTVAIGYVGVPGTNVRWAYREVMWDEGLERAANSASNNSGGENDDQLLAQLDYELSQMENGDELLALTGQDEKQMKRLLESVGVGDDPDTADPGQQDDEPDKPEKLEFALTRDQRLVIERTLELVKQTRDLQAIERPSLNGAALFVICEDYLKTNEPPDTVAAEGQDGQQLPAPQERLDAPPPDQPNA